MNVLITGKYQKDWTVNSPENVETPSFQYKSIGIFLNVQGQITQSWWSDLAEIQHCLRYYACPSNLQIKNGSD